MHSLSPGSQIELRACVGSEGTSWWQLESNRLVRVGEPTAVDRPTRVAVLPDAAEGRFVLSRAALEPAADATMARQAVTPITSSSCGEYAAVWTREPLAAFRLLAERHRCEIEAAAPADFAWAAAFADAAGAAARGVCVVQLGGAKPHVRLLAVADEQPVALRRLPSRTEPGMLALAIQGLLIFTHGDATSSDPTMLVLGDSAFRDHAEAEGMTAGCAPAPVRGAAASVEFEPEAVAAWFAGLGPRFVPPDVVAAARSGSRRRAALAAAAAGVLLVAAGVLDILDLRREMAAVERARAGHGNQVQAMVDSRSGLEAIAAGVTDLEALRAGHPRWTAVIAGLAQALPRETRLTGLRTRGDSLHLDLEGPDASAAFQAMGDAPWFSVLRTTAPVRREVGDAGDVIERFSVATAVSWVDFNTADGR